MDDSVATTLRTEDGLELPARWWRADNAHAVVVLVHGFTASKDDPAVGAVADRMQAVGYDVMSYDARGHGASAGLSTLGDLERHDVAAAVEAVRKHGLPIVLVGASMGAIAVLRHAAETDGLSGVVTVSAPARWQVPRTWRSLLAVGLTQTRPGRALAAKRLGARISPVWTWSDPPVSLVEKIRAPIAFIHGARDRFILPKAAAELYERAAEPRRLEIVPGMGHAYDPAGTAAILGAISWVLTTPPASTPDRAD
jgi:alpha-beta hydrolase superfamily lysophospholipase